MTSPMPSSRSTQWNHPPYHTTVCQGLTSTFDPPYLHRGLLRGPLFIKLNYLALKIKNHINPFYPDAVHICYMHPSYIYILLFLQSHGGNADKRLDSLVAILSHIATLSIATWTHITTLSMATNSYCNAVKGNETTSGTRRLKSD